MTDEPEKKEDDLYHVLEKGIREVLENEKSTIDNKMEAVGLGTKLLLVKYKIPEAPEKKDENFFKGKNS